MNKLRCVIDVGKTTCTITGYTEEGGSIVFQNSYPSDWVTKGYDEFISFLNSMMRISQQVTFSYVQILLPFPFDYISQRITQVKSTRPDFLPTCNFTQSLYSHIKDIVTNIDAVYFIHDGQARATAYLHDYPGSSFIILNYGSGFGAVSVSEGKFESIEVEEYGTTFQRLGGKAVINQLQKIANYTESNSYEMLVDLCKGKQEYDQFLQEQQSAWNTLLHMLNRQYKPSRFVIPEKLILSAHISIKTLQSLPYESISEENNLALNNMDLHLDQEFTGDNARIFPSGTLYAKEPTTQAFDCLYKLKQTQPSTQISKFFQQQPTTDVRTYQGNFDLAKTAYALSRIANLPMSYPLPKYVRLNNAIPAFYKYVVEFAESFNIIAGLSAQTCLSVVIPVYEEETRLTPPSATNSLGETFLSIKVYQMESLFIDSAARYQLLIIDDGSNDRTYRLLKAQALFLNKLLKKGCIKVFSLGELLDSKSHPLKIGERLKSPKESIKGGASFAGIEIAMEDSEYILLSDADLEIGLGSSAVLLRPFQEDPQCALTIAYRQKFLSNAGKGISYLIHVITNKDKFNDVFRYLLKRFALCHTYFPALMSYPDYQTGFKVLRGSAFRDFMNHVINFKDSYDFDLLEYALAHATVHNVSVTPIFISLEATKFPFASKIAKFDYYQRLAKQRYGVSYYLRLPLFFFYYFYSLCVYLLIPCISYPGKFRKVNTYFSTLKI